MIDSPFPPDLQQLVADEMNAGNYQSPQDVVRAGIQLLRLQREEFERLKAEVQVGIDQLERGEYHDYTREELREFFEKLKDRARLTAEASTRDST